MPFVSHNGYRTFYRTSGTGPLVVLLHGHMLDSQCWLDGGFAEAFLGDHTVALVDALGHGRSDKPADPAAYGQREQAGRIAAVMDQLGCETADIVGHSMGGWTAVGLAKYVPQRLRSLTLCGWDPVKGPSAGFPPGFEEHLPFDEVLEVAQIMIPQHVAWVTPADEPGLRAGWEALGDLDGAEQALLSSRVRVLLWSGRDDRRGASMQAFAERHGFTMIWTPGDHLGVVFDHGGEGARAIRAALGSTKEGGRDPLATA